MATDNQQPQITDELKKHYLELLSEELPVLRIKLGVSQDELGNMIGLTRQTYSSLETRRRSMTWSVFLSLIFIFDNNEKTHDLIREKGIFPEVLVSAKEESESNKNNVLSQFISPDIRESLDEQALHSIETIIMVEYARCNNMSGQAVVKAFNGRQFGEISEKNVLIQKTINKIKKQDS